MGILGQNGQFWTVFGQNGQNGNFFKKALGTFFSHLQALTNCKVSERSNERFSSNSMTDVRTDGRESLGLQRLRRETKKCHQNQSAEKRQHENNDAQERMVNFRVNATPEKKQQEKTTDQK